MSSTPGTLYGLAHILARAYHGDDLQQLSGELIARIGDDGQDAAALLDLAIVRQVQGQTHAALDLQWQALQLQQHYRLRSNPLRPACRLLAVMGPGTVMDNTPLEFLLEHSDIALELLFLGAGVPSLTSLPDHDVAFVAVCESDANQPLLAGLQDVMSCWPQPYLNRPLQIAALARDGLSDRLAGIAGARVVASQRFGRGELANASGLSLEYPLIVRPANTHAGHGLCRVAHAGELAEYLQGQVAAEYSVAPFVDYRTPADGLYRKMRVACVGGDFYPAHLAVSPRWMVHYLNADMLQSAANRQAEQQFMERFELDFLRRHAAVLSAIDDRLGLEYYSIDCGQTPDGQLLVFEIDSGAVVHAMDPEDIFPYKRPHMLRLFAAFRDLVHRAAAGGQATGQVAPGQLAMGRRAA